MWLTLTLARTLILTLALTLALNTFTNPILISDPNPNSNPNQALAAGRYVSPAHQQELKKLGKQLSAESFVAMESSYDAALRERRDAVVAAVDALAPLNPTAAPLDGWRGRNGRDACALDGRWALRFTNAADATFKRDDARGAATTSQTIDSAAGLFVNCVDFDGDGKLRGFRVEVEGEALNDSEVQLVFKRVRLLRRSRFPRLFGTITIPLPNPRRLRKFSRGLIGKKVDASDRGAGFALLYVDDDVRMHRTFDGLLFVQQRLADGASE